MTTSELHTYRRLFTEKYHEINYLLDELPAEVLIWKPFDQSPWRGPAGSIGWLVAHSVSSTVYLLRRAEWILGWIEWAAVDGDEGSNEFGPANHDPIYLRNRVERTHHYVHQLLDRLSAADLEGSRPNPQRPGRLLTVRYDLQHAIEHMSQHIGHAQLTRQLWALQAQSA